MVLLLNGLRGVLVEPTAAAGWVCNYSGGADSCTRCCTDQNLQ